MDDTQGTFAGGLGGHEELLVAVKGLRIQGRLLKVKGDIPSCRNCSRNYTGYSMRAKDE